MARRRRNRRPAARGRYRFDSPERRIVTPDFQADIPFELRHRYKELKYPNGNIVKKTLKKPRIGVSIRSNMLSIIPRAKYKPSHLKEAEIAYQRFKIVNMNDNWRAWDEEQRLRKIIARRRDYIQQSRYLTGLPGIPNNRLELKPLPSQVVFPKTIPN